MNDSLRNDSVLLPLVLFLGVVFAGCITASAPSAPVGAPFCSPFLESGELADWAVVAIRQGIGLQISPYVAPYPGNRVVPRDKPYRHRAVSLKDQRTADQAARLIGGWDLIDSTSTVKFAKAEDLALHLFSANAQHPRYAEALAATMTIYPKLRAVYYTVTSGG